MQQIIVYSFILLLLLAVGAYFACRWLCASCCAGPDSSSQSYTPVATETDPIHSAPSSSSHAPRGMSLLNSGSKELPKPSREKEIEMQRSARMASMPSSYPKAEVPPPSPTHTKSAGTSGKGNTLGLTKAVKERGGGAGGGASISSSSSSNGNGNGGGSGSGSGSGQEEEKRKPVVKSGLGAGRVTKLDKELLDDIDMDGW